MSTTIEDMKSGMSSCCSAAVYTDWGICSDCKEHCDIVEEENEDSTTNRTFSAGQQATIARLEKKCADADCDDNGHKCV